MLMFDGGLRRQLLDAMLDGAMFSEEEPRVTKATRDKVVSVRPSTAAHAISKVPAPPHLPPHLEEHDLQGGSGAWLVVFMEEAQQVHVHGSPEQLSIAADAVHLNC